MKKAGTKLGWTDWLLILNASQAQDYMGANTAHHLQSGTLAVSLGVHTIPGDGEPERRTGSYPETG